MFPRFLSLLLAVSLTGCAGPGTSGVATAGPASGEPGRPFAQPRLLFTSDELPGLRERFSGDRLRPIWEEVLGDARDFCDPDSSRFVSPGWVAEVPGPWLLMHGRHLAGRLETIGFAYQLTGDEALGRHGALLLETVARELPVTHPKIARERVLAGARGDMLRVFATGCDWLGAALSDEQRAIVEATALEYLEVIYDEVGPEGEVMGPYHNFNGVVMGAAGSLAIHFLDTEPELAENILELAVRVIGNWLERSIDEKGAYLEGTSYPNYGLFNVLFFAEGLKRIGRGDLLDHPHLRQMPYFYAMSLLPGEGVFDARNSAFYESSVRLPMLKLAQEFNDPLARWLADYTEGPLENTPWRLLYENDVQPAAPSGITASLADHFEQRGLVIFRTGWEASDVMFSIEAGPYYPITHNEADEGHFTLYGLGWRWAIDSGSRQSPTHAHNSVLVNGVGQSVSGRSYGTSGKILDYLDDPAYGYVRADVAEAYRENNAGIPAVPLERALRHAFWIKPSDGTPAYAVILDDMHKDGRPHRFSWLLQTSSEMEVSYSGNTARVRPVPAYDRAFLETAAGTRGRGEAVWHFKIDRPGDYRAWARVRGIRASPGSARTGSFFVQMNDDPEFPWEIPSTFLYDWFWGPVRSPSTPSPVLPPDLGDHLHENARSGDPEILREMGRSWHTWKTLRRFYPERDHATQPFALEAGENTVRFHTRERNTQVDRVVLFRDGERFPPFSFDDPSLLVLDASDAEVNPPMQRVEVADEPLPTMAVHLHGANGIAFSEDTYQFHPRVWAETEAVNPRFAAVLVPLPPGIPEPAIRFVEDDAGLQVIVQWPSRTDTIHWPDDPTRKASLKQLQ